MTPEQEAYLSKAADSLRAERLLADEGLPGFAASRAYYAMFYVTEALLLSEGLSFSKHSAVISAFGQRFAKTERLPPGSHRRLIEAHEIRHAGDYDVEASVSPETAAEQIQHAEEFLEMGRRFLGASHE